MEETLNALMDAEADEICGARKFERSDGCKDTGAGSYDRQLQTKAGEVMLTVSNVDRGADWQGERSGGMLKSIRAQEDAKAAKEKAFQIIEKLKIMRLARAAEIVANGIDETLSYYSMASDHRRCLRTNNPLERLMREIRRRTRVVGAFPDGQSALMLVAARLRHVATTKWGTKRYLQMNRLAETVAIA